MNGTVQQVAVRMPAQRRPLPAPWADVRRILCVRADNMGDVVMTGPAIRALQETWPQAHITLMASPSGAAIGRRLPGVHALLPYTAPWVKQDAAPDAAADARMLETVRAGGFDAAVVFTVYTQSALPAALFCHLAGIPRIAAHVRENPYGIVTHWVPDTAPQDDGRHEVQRQLDLVAALGAHTPDPRLRLCHPAHAEATLTTKLAARDLPTRGWVVVHPGATAASRRYPAARFAQAVAALHPELPVIVTGSAAEHDLAEAVCQGAGRGANLAGLLDLDELVVLLTRARLLVSNNSGPVHLAAATGTPVVDLYALTNPQHTPWRVRSRVLNHDVPCRYCYRSVCPEGHHACLTGVTPQQVTAAAHELIDAHSPS